MKKIVYLPMDERPCNAIFPVKLFSDVITICSPSVLGNKKTPANWENVHDFLLRETEDADALILSMDLLLYGGLVPSRLHHLSREAVRERLETIRHLKKNRPTLLIYAYQCIMRCPKYSSSEEELYYYADYGKEIFQLGEAQHRYRLGLCQRDEMEALYKRIPEDLLKDYLARREFNLNFNMETLDLVADGTIDFLIFPQDDCARYGFTALDQEKIRARISELRLDMKVLMYPGADELGLTMMTRMLVHFSGKRPRIYIKMASTSASLAIPPFEDRPLGETLKYHLIAAGCRMATCLSEADIVLGVSFPGKNGRGDDLEHEVDPGITVERTLSEFVLFLEDALDMGKTVTLADNALANGADMELISILGQQNMLQRLNGYAGWNTSSNTIGTAIAEGVHAFIVGMTQAHWDFLGLRYLEDAGYCSVVRQQITREELFPRNYDYFDVGEQRGEISELVRTKLLAFARDCLPGIAEKLQILDVWMPWCRMFEVGLTVYWKRDGENNRYE